SGISRLMYVSCVPALPLVRAARRAAAPPRALRPPVSCSTVVLSSMPDSLLQHGFGRIVAKRHGISGQPAPEPVAISTTAKTIVSLKSQSVAFHLRDVANQISKRRRGT